MNCPRCRAGLHPVPVRNSVSRLDNTTLICNDCGNQEALFNHWWPDRDLPPLDQRVVT